MKLKIMVLASGWVPAFMWAAVIYLFSAVPSLATPWREWDFLLRKGAHVLEYALLGILLMRAFENSGMRNRRSVLWSFLAAVIYAGTDEIHQSYVRGRFCSPVDVSIDAFGAALGTVLYFMFRLKKRD